MVRGSRGESDQDHGRRRRRGAAAGAGTVNGRRGSPALPDAGHAVLAPFHPAVREWFLRRFPAPTDAQAAGWPHIGAGRDVLIAAPTGSGKTLAAFLVAIDELLKQEPGSPPAPAPVPAGRAAAAGRRPPARAARTTSVVYVSPLKALGNDIHRNLDEPLEEIRAVADELGIALPAVTTAVRSGDTPQAERQAMVRSPPDILITTPESLYLMLTAARSRESLRGVRMVIVDEIHALARDKRGSHLSLTLARLDHVVESAGNARPARVGLSATQRPIEELGAFLVGGRRLSRGAPAPASGSPVMIDLGHQRDLDLSVEVPPTDLQAVASKEQWSDVYDRLAELVRSHRTTLIFVNTRRLSERVAHNLSQRFGNAVESLEAKEVNGFDAVVASHHGSLSRERRLAVEERLKSGRLRALVATASLELGIDIGSIDLVCQIGSPRSIATLLQRVGRSGHALGLTPKGLLFPTTRDELVECAALVRAVRGGRLDRVVQPVAPLDILAQQVVAEVSCEDWGEDALFALARRAHPYRDLGRSDFDEVIEMLAEGVGEGAGRSPPLVHRDRINRVLRGRRGARMTALLNGGAIPEIGDYRVIADPDETVVGTVNEDFAVESMAGDIFLLGSTSWRIRRVESRAGVVRVESAGGAPPTVPFWLGEAPGRTLELSEEVGRLRSNVAALLGEPDGREAAVRLLRDQCGLGDLGAVQVADYLIATREALGIVPSDRDIVFERFFDEPGGMQLVVHAPFGARINRAYGLTLRKRFCVNFDFELQAAASDDAIVLSLGPQHSFPLEEAFDFVSSRNAAEALTQAILYVPTFPTRWRWDATRALAVLRQRGGRKVPPPIQRMRADDLLAAVFPAQVGCQENLSGPLQIPDHPLVRQAVNDCLHEAMDLEGLVALLRRIEAGEVRLHARDTVEPSPMAHEILNGKPYTYLDDAPLEERRTRAVALRRSLPDNAAELGALDDQAIARVREEAWPAPRDPEEVHDALLGLVTVRPQDAPQWAPWVDVLTVAGRAATATLPAPAGTSLWLAAESINLVRLLYPGAEVRPALSLPEGAAIECADREEARARLLRGHTEALGPVTAADLGARVGLGERDVDYGLRTLEAGGYVLRGRFTPVPHGEQARSVTDLPAPSGAREEFCDRRLLARIHRYTLDRLRREIDPVSAQDFMRFLLRWHHLTQDTRLDGKLGLRQAVNRLQGFEIAAAAWEREVLSARVKDYRISWLDELCLGGEVAWARLTPRRAAPNGAGPVPTRQTPVALALRPDLPRLLAAVRGGAPPSSPGRGAAADVWDLLEARGALFFDEIVNLTRRLRTDVERGLRELVARGLVTADGFQGLRQLTGGVGRSRSPRLRGSYGPGGVFAGAGPSGRWALVAAHGEEGFDPEALAEFVARVLLARYGVVFRDLIARESLSLPWRDVLRALRRLEARGLVRGGRFVSGFVGEQYALPEAVDSLRRVRRTDRDGERVWVSAVDPLNLAGVIVPGRKLAAQPGKGVLFVDGLPLDGTA